MLDHITKAVVGRSLAGGLDARPAHRLDPTRQSLTTIMLTKLSRLFLVTATFYVFEMEGFTVALVLR